ncbi:MAG: SusC/RagA family TonB-linked outer membrane protein [Paludibacter sp.]|nr:SusC/RagA family TonB-linked outer membrane protein [Paludibacter sp.]
MRKRILLLVCLFVVTAGAIYAQSKSISGKVYSTEDRQAIIGASVLLKGTTTGTITDVNGNFTINLPENAKTLVVSYVGMKTVELEAKNNMVVYLESSTSELDEVLVVAYGTTTKKSFTGAAATVKGDKLSKLQSSSVTKSLEGSVAGVQISSSSGQPGEDAAIRIRGLGSISASQSPLIVVDGVPYEGSLNSISTQDIESLNVLKDAAANSMYGARGSNGVILITTKKGKTGVTKVNVESRLGVNSRGVKPYDVITNAGDYYEMTWEAVRNNLVENAGKSYYEANHYVSNNLISQFLGYNIFKGIADNNLINPATGRLNAAATEKKWADNWLSEPFQNGLRQEYNVNMSGGSDKTVVYMSFGYLSDKGYVVNSDFTRINTRLKFDQKLSDDFKMGANVSYSKTSSNAPVSSGGSSNYSNMFMFSQMIAPIYPIYKYDLGTGAALLNAQGKRQYDFGSGLVESGLASSKTRAYGPQQNPLYTQKENISQTGDDNLSVHSYAELKFLKDFRFTFNLAYDVFSTNSTEFATPLAGDALGYGYGYKGYSRYAALNSNQLLNYSKKMGFHDFNILMGHESKMDDYWTLNGGKKNYFDPFNPEFTNAGATTSLSSYTAQYRIEGYLSRAEYSYRDRYYGSVSFRRDGSSKFAPAVRWGNFWSVGGAWRVSEEDFMSGIHLISNLKLKSSYGTQGNDAIRGSNLFMDQFSMVSDGTEALPVFSYRGSPTLTWEKSNNFNIGIEMGLLNRINITTDFFIKETTDMIYAKPLPPSGGSPSWIWDNQIDMRNTGLEFEVMVDLFKNKNIKWDVSVNGTTYKNVLTRLPADKDPTGYKAGTYWRKLGGSLYDWYLNEYAGVELETGLSMWYMNDEDGNKVATTVNEDADYYEISKSAIPYFYGGLSSSLTAYSFDLSFQTAFQLGGYVYDDVYSSLMGGGEPGQNWHKDIYTRWTPYNNKSNIPRVSSGDQNANASSSRFLISSSYFSLRNVTLGYTFPKSFLKKYKIDNLRIYAVGDNLWLLSARKGLDPRQSFSGDTFTGTYSALLTTSLGISVGF